jgi:uncharacterized protein (TIGR00299 family) protein
MKILYFDCFSGISGDMSLGALLDLGINIERFQKELDKLQLSGYEIIIARKLQNGISGTDVKVLLDEDAKRCNESFPKHSQESAHPHNPMNQNNSDPNHKCHHSQPARNLSDIENLIDNSDLTTKVKDFSKMVFREIAKAEAKVHNQAVNEVHFHEVGAVDSIIDIVGTAICLDMIGAEKVFSSPLHDGYGHIECRHGVIPVPVPAVMEMLAGSGITIVSEAVNTELITPTGMGLIKCLTQNFGAMPQMTVDKIGYGLGKRETGRLNALRVVLGTSA